MTEKEIVKYVEQCLHDYPANLTRIEVLRKDLQILRLRGDVHAQNYENLHVKTTKKYSDPVSAHVEKIEYLEAEIERLKRNTEPLTKMIQDLKSPYSLETSLNSDMIKIIGLHYFGRNPLSAILDATGWSRAGFFRKKKQLAELARSYLGY